MRGVFNDALRFVIARVIRRLGLILDVWQRIRILRFKTNQRRLRQKYRLQSDTPVLSYGPRVVESIRHAASRYKTDARFAMTSGSTGEPKKMLYTKRRLRSLRFVFSEMFARACRAYRLRRTSLYVFSSFQQDASLTSLLLDEHKLPPYLSALQAPYRVQQHPAIRTLAAEYGAAAIRLWILALSNPGVLYATNPSTISTFLDELKNDWPRCSQLVRNWHIDPHRFDCSVHKIAQRIQSRGSSQRLQLIATSNEPVPLQQFAPSVNAYICWTGGYVQPFLDRLAVHLPASQYRMIPMYSMSTETIETETVFRNSETYFLPLASRVVYEFTEADGTLLTADQLKPDRDYSLVVSDPYGLRRYQTEDLFHCRRKINGLPDLIFLRRRGLEYSFTGEKVTAEQLTTVFDQLRVQHPELDGFLTCVPSHSPLPHYKLVFISESKMTSQPVLASECDKLLADLNREYKSKRVNGTLGPITFVQTTSAGFAKHFSTANTWETQFKFLPLYQRIWESTMSSFEHSLTSPVS